MSARSAPTPATARRTRAQAGQEPAQGIEQALHRVALELFVERGFHGTSMRDIAARVGTSVSHVYYYFPSKGDVLRSMLMQIVQDLLHCLHEALSKVPGSPDDRLRAIVRAQVLFHCHRQAEAFVGRSELRSLDPEHRSEVVALYDQVTKIFKDAIDDGVRKGVFRCAYRAEATNAIVTMCNAVSTWYSKEGRLSPERLADRYVELALQMLGHAHPSHD